MARATAVYDFTLAANGSREIICDGTYWRLQSATGNVSVRRDGGSLISLVQPGQGEQDTPFTRLTITDTSGSANSGTLIVSDGSFVDVRQVGGKATQSNVFANSTVNVTAASAQMVGASSGRQYLLVQNNDPAVTIYIGFGASAVSAANGIKLLPGQSYEQFGVVTTQALQVIGSAVTSNVVLVVG